ncbi:MAG: asparagine synthase (glutamine-hydrolyzing), partial [Planctomycetota bacterium]|nr:asparagine synthase (glutamine-hydrolyzing) [Planctomycetota bacterium]
MCGICGSVHLDGGPVDRSDVDAMLAAMHHRGPDAEGTFAEPGIVAGIRRLAVIDLEGGDQPIANEDGSVRVVFNGEIYNFRELRRELEAKGHRFRTRSDTEVLVHGWEEYGPALLPKLNGMFAFCLYDGRTHEIFLARDRFGIKPLYFRLEDGRLQFASEIGVLLKHREVPGDVDLQILIDRFCLQYVPCDATVYRSIRKLLPGQALHVRDGGAELVRWYTPPAASERDDAVDLESCAVELRDLLKSAVRYRTIADVPLGVFLSGGLDSSAIATLLTEIADEPVHTFSVGFDGPEAFDEREQARAVSEHLGTTHHEMVVSPVQIAEHLPALIDHLAEPVTDPALIPTYVLSKFARERVTVALAGEGADELFGGYRRYRYQQSYGWMAHVPALGSVAKSPVGTVLPRRVRQALEAIDTTDPVRNHLLWSSTVGFAVAEKLFHRESVQAFAQRTAETFAPYFRSDSVDLASQLRADQNEWLPHNLLAKVDRASMAVSLEARVPFLDHRVVEWAAGLPDGMKIHGKQTKRVLRAAFRDLPPRVLEGPKRGFDLPLAEWIRGPLRERVTDHLSPSSL